MTDTEMIVWSANGSLSYVNTYYSTGNVQHDVLTYDPACYANQFNYYLSGKYVKFYSTRSLECTPDNPAHPQGYVIQLNQDTDFIYSFSPPGGNYQLENHQGNRGNFACPINSDGSLCTVYVPPPVPEPPAFATSTIEASNGSKLLIY